MKISIGKNPSERSICKLEFKLLYST